MTQNRGAALVLALMAVALLSALGLSLSVLTAIEMRVSANFATGQEARNAAEAALEPATRELLAMPDWTGVAAGSVKSAFVDGPASGTRALSDGTTIDLASITALLGDTAWHLFAYGPAASLGLESSSAYLVVWARADPSSGGLLVRSDAFGPSGTRRGVKIAMIPSGVLSWTEIR